MKKLLLLIMITMSANAWTCESYSNDGAYGVATYPNYRTAWNSALANCIYYKSYYATCRVTSCW